MHEHGTLTGPQIQALLFATPAAARVRLGRLRRQGWIANFHTRRSGRPLPVHWVLDDWGSRWAAFNAGEDEPTARQTRARSERLAASTQLEHTDGAHDFFVALITASRLLAQDSPGEPPRLARWWSARHTAKAMDQRVRPDGHGVWATAGVQVPFYLEYDRGTEPLPRLIAKFPAYRQIIADSLGPAWPVLIVVPTSTRERHLHQTAAEARNSAWSGAHPYQSHETLQAYSRLKVLTTSREHLQEHPYGPAGPVWRTLTGPGSPDVPRIALADFTAPASRFPAEYAICDPGPAGPDEDPLHEPS
nr:replication-relaxation family protein [Kineosporia babensis]